jgi:hypothetical protein
MLLKDVALSANPDECIDTLVTLHRRHYYEPGYVLDGEKIYASYQQVYTAILECPPGTSKGEIQMKLNHDTNTYSVTYNSKPLHEYNLTRDHLPNTRVTYPKDMTTNQVMVEILYEITYKNMLN